MARWGIYLRLSKEDVRGGEVSEANSIAGQRRTCRAYIERVDPDAEIIEFGEEEFISASQGLDRPAYKRMLSAVATGELDCIAARDQDRFTRDRDVEFGQLKVLAKSAGVEAHAADSGPLFDTIDREFTSGIRGEFGQFFAKVTGKNTKIGLQTKREQGAWTGRRQFGYLAGGVVNPEQAAHIRWAYSQILDHGKTARDVFEHWRRTGVLTVNGEQWTSVGRVMDMLRNPALAGLVTYKGEVLEGVKAQWEAIVTPEEQRRLQATLAARVKTERGYARRKPRRHWLSGLVLCGNPDCDLQVMNSQDPGNGRRYYYWHCDRRRGGCGNRLRGPELEDVVKYAAFALLRSTPAPPRLVEDFDDTELREVERQIREVRASLQSRAMSAADAVPVLQGLRAQLAQQEALRDRFTDAQQKANDWHSTEYLNVSRGEGDSIRRLVDNVRVIPNHGGVIIEGTNGAVIELAGDDYARAAAGLDGTDEVMLVLTHDDSGKGGTWKFTAGEPEGVPVKWRRKRPRPVRQG